MLYAYIPKTEYVSWTAKELVAKRPVSPERYLKEVGVRTLLGEAQLRSIRSAYLFGAPRTWFDSKLHYEVALDKGFNVKILL